MAQRQQHYSVVQVTLCSIPIADFNLQRRQSISNCHGDPPIEGCRLPGPQSACLTPHLRDLSSLSRGVRSLKLQVRYDTSHNRRIQAGRDQPGAQSVGCLVPQSEAAITGYDRPPLRADRLRPSGEQCHARIRRDLAGFTNPSSSPYQSPLLSWFTRSPCGGHMTGLLLARVVVVPRDTPRSLSTQTSRRLPSADTAACLS